MNKEEIEESNTYKISVPFIIDEEIKNIDNNFDSIVNQFTKQFVNQKDLSAAQYIIKKQQQYIEQLENKVKENEFKNNILDKRLKHLLQSETIRKYDEKDNITGKYKLEIKELDKSEKEKTEDIVENRTFGQVLDEMLNNPEAIIIQCKKIVQETKEEAEKIEKENKILKEQILAQDNEIYDLQGEIRGMKYIIENIKTEGEKNGF